MPAPTEADITANKILRADGTWVTASSGGGGTWGSITGTLSAQTDLQTALDTKIDGSLTATRVPFASDANTLADSANLTWDNTLKNLSVTHTSLGATTATAFTADNSTAATNVLQQVSPATVWSGRAWNSGSSTSQPVRFRTWVQPLSSSSPSGIWKLQHSTNNAAYANLFEATSGNDTAAGFKFTSPAAQSNSSPSTTRLIQFENSGTQTWFDFTFGSTQRANIGVSNSGEISFYTLGGNYVGFYNKSGGSLYSYNFPTAFVHTGGGRFGSSVHAGSTSAPTSMLQSAGGFATKVKRITAPQTLDDTATKWLLDGTDAAACSGTPSASCASWSNQSDCEKWDAHGGCSWFAGSDCSVYNNEFGMGTCTGTSGCTSVTASCAGAGDESSCLAQDDSYGGSCSWSAGSDCSAFNGNEATCAGTSGCSVSGSNTCFSFLDYTSCDAASPCFSINSGDCNTLSDAGGDGTLCATQPQCSYDSGSGVCSGSFFTSCGGDNSTCSGTYGAGCSGDYFTGSCTGTFGAACSGTATCAGINDSTNCGLETGCTWSSVLNITLPNIDSFPDKDYYLYNDASGGADSIIYPATASPAQTINNTTSYTLSSYKQGIHISPFRTIGDCSIYNGDEGTCGSTTGCSPNYTNCTWNGASCEGGGSCASQGDEGNCVITTYYTSCSGTYTVSKDWKIWSTNT